MLYVIQKRENYMMKQFFSAIMAVLLTVTILTGCGRRGLNETELTLQEQWIDCLEFTEETYEIMGWVFSYAEVFAGDNSWDSMMKARAACDSAILALNSMEAPEPLLSQEQYSALMADGIEADVVYQESQYLDTSRSYRVDTLRRLESYLRDDIYLAPSADQLSAWLETNRKNIRLQCEYMCLTTNYLLLQLGDDSLWKEMTERFPTIAAAQTAWNRDPEALQVECGEVLNSIEDLLKDENAYLGTSEYTLKIVEEAVKTGNLSRLAAITRCMDGVPAYFPLPFWMPAETMWHYLVPDTENDSPRFVQVGEPIDQVPSACYIACNTISLEDTTAYGEYLSQWGIETYGKWNESQDTWQLLAKNGNSTMMISWTADEVVLYLTEPVGCLIPDLYLRAMTME